MVVISSGILGYSQQLLHVLTCFHMLYISPCITERVYISHIYTPTHTHIHPHTHIYIHISTHIHTDINTHAYICTLFHNSLNCPLSANNTDILGTLSMMLLATPRCVCTCVYACVYMCARMCVYI